MKTTITLTGKPNTLPEPDGHIRVDRAIEVISTKEGGVCLFFLGEGTRVNFSIRMNHLGAYMLAQQLLTHVEVG